MRRATSDTSASSPPFAFRHTDAHNAPKAMSEGVKYPGNGEESTMTGFPTPSPLSNYAIADYASVVGQHHQIYNEVGRADLDRLLEATGGRVSVSTELFGSEALTVYTPGNYEVHLPQLTSGRRDRFTIAHEIGHYFLHYLHPGLRDVQTFGRGSRNRAETQANIFAASLLMPSDRFIEAWREHNGDSWAIGDTFGVSPSAASVRAQVLGLA